MVGRQLQKEMENITAYWSEAFRISGCPRFKKEQKTNTLGWQKT